MAEVDVKVDVDLEDGEIESDSEPTVEAVPEKPANAAENDPPAAADATVPKENKDKEKDKEKNKERERQLLELLKKSPAKPEKKKTKVHHRKPKEHKPEKSRSYISNHMEDDFAGSIENAIKKELNRIKESQQNQEKENADSGVEDSDSKRKHKKRKKHDYPEKESSSKKKKVDDNAQDDEVDEDEMMCIRGASPVHRRRRSEENYVSGDENASCPSDDSDREYGHGRDRRNRNFNRRGEPRDSRSDRFRQRFDRHRIDKHAMVNPDGICLFYMQGKCYKGDDCVYSHDARPPRKMELCKFYLMDCCAKRDKCLYLHSDFPCKYFHTGLPCPNKNNCKFSHGKPLSEDLKLILLKHIESAPKEILGDFPRLNRESATLMLTNTQNRLKQQYSKDDNEEKGEQSPGDQTMFDNQIESIQSEIPLDTNSQSKSRKSKVRQSRWRDPSPVRTPNMTAAAENILSIQNLNGVLTPNQISDLTKMGITSLNQLSQLTVIQLNQLGITVNQINEIQLNTLNIQKLGLIDNNAAPTSNLLLNKVKLNTDFDMRVSPGVGDITTTSIPAKQVESVGKDVDMRFQTNDSDTRNDSNKRKSSLDIDQYTKDALNFSMMNKDTNLNSIHSTDALKLEKNEAEADVDHRVLNYVRDASIANVKLTNEDDILSLNENDTDIRLNSLPMKQQEMFLPMQKKNEDRSRRPTTDDEDDSLQIDEKWYSSDEEPADKLIPKIKSPPQIEKHSDNSKDITEPSTVFKNIGDLSKIDISAEVTQLLTSIKSSTMSEITAASKKDYLKTRDPRNLPKSSSESKETSNEGSRKISHKPEFVSIYDCIDNSNLESVVRRSDVDLRASKDIDFRMPSFGDTDLRQTPGGTDVDLRLGLPLKLLPNYTPATEIDGSIGSHAPITYKVYSIDIPRPDYTDIKNSTHKSQAIGDPRLRKIFRLSIDEPTSDTEKPTKLEKTAPPIRSDPRKRTIECNDNNFIQKPAPLDIQVLIQTSEWYKNLSSNHKILTNQQLATVTSSLKKFHADKTIGKKFDLTDIKSNNMLCMIFSNLGVFLDENGEYFRLNSQDTLIPNMPPNNFNQAPDMFMGNMMDNMNMMNMNPNFLNNMGPINNMAHMLPVNNYDPRFSGGDPRGAPGILGMPPNNFDHLPMSNYNNDNYNMNYDNAYDGPGNNGDDYMNDDMDDDYYRDHKSDYKNSYRGGRNNDRWSRGRPRGGNGSNSSGGRDRRGYTERGGWKNDRR